MSKAIRHAFEALEALNCYEALRVSELARALDLPRTTAVRAIRALESMGYVIRRPDDSRYLLSQRVQALAGGFGELERFVSLARPIADTLCREMKWPISVVVPHGLGLRIAYSTDSLTPHKIFTSPAGGDLPLRDSASGIVYLAHCADDMRKVLLEEHGDGEVASKFHRTDAELQAALRVAQETGYFFQNYSFVSSKLFDGFQDKECILAVPVLTPGRVVAVLSTRMLTRALQRGWVDRVMRPRLQAAAAEMAAAFAQPDVAAFAGARASRPPESRRSGRGARSRARVPVA